MKRYVKTTTEEFTDDLVYYSVYELDEDGDECDCLGRFDSLDGAIKFAQEQSCPTHICFMTDIDPDDDLDVAEWLEYSDYPYEYGEVVWKSEQ